jgi:tetratricopeptide (TPR) repeat protein
VSAGASGRERAWVALLLGAGALALYVRVAGHQFLHYDDVFYVTRNRHVLAGLTWSGVGWAFSNVDAWNWHPLTWLSHMLDVQLFGPRAGAHLLVNASLHAVNAVLVYMVLARLTGRPGRSLLVAALFAVHPLHVESVAWVSQRKDVLSTLFGLLALWAYAAYARRPGLGRYLLVALLFAASLMAKPMWVTLPFVLLLLDFWPLERKDGFGRLALEKLPLLAMSAAASAVAVLAQGDALRGLELGLQARLGNAALSYLGYVGKTFWPVSLSVFYPHPGSDLPPWPAVGAALVVMALTGAAISQMRRRPWITVGWLWFVGMLVPVIGLVQVGGQAMADRYTYAPGIGLLVVLVWSAAEFAETSHATRLARVVAAAVVAILSALTWHQIGFWSDHVTLFTHAVEVTRDNGLAHHTLSQGLAEQGRWPEALAHARAAVRLEPRIARVHKNLGYILYRAGFLDESIAELRQAIALEPDYAEAHGNLAIALGRKGLMDEAAQEMALERRLRERASPR